MPTTTATPTTTGSPPHKSLNGNYHANGTEYWTEIETFQRIVQDGTLAGGAASFYVDHGNGLRSYFGDTSDSLVDTGPGGAGRIWYISHTVDQFGNTIEYSYDNPTTDETVPETISGAPGVDGWSDRLRHEAT